MKRILFIHLVLIFLIGISSQIVVAQNSKWCLTDEMNQQLLSENPELLQHRESIKKKRNNLISSKSQSMVPTVVPVVFHIVYADVNGPENIPSSFVKAIVDELNLDFQKLNPDTSNIVSAFSPIIGNPNFEFRLATKDPNGNCTNGINRVQNASFSNDGTQNFRPSGTSWPRNRYLNIWVVKGFSVSGVAAYSFVPESANPTFNTQDGVVIQYTYLNPSNSQFSVTLSHEIGHYFDLWHTWGSQTGGVGSGQPGDPANCNDDDGVSDTPNTIGANSSCNLNRVSCGSLDNSQNYMDYAFCGSYMFTQGQASRIQNSLVLYPYRANLVSPSNLVVTGTDDASYQTPACPPTADFVANQTRFCEGESVTFSNQSYHAFADPNNFTYIWTFSGASTNNSILENPTITYNTAGDYNVSLDVSLPSLSTSSIINKNNYIKVVPQSGSYIAPYIEQFSNPTWPNNSDVSLSWSIEKPASSIFQFQRSTNAFYSPPSGIFLNNFSFNNEGEFTLTTPVADLSNMQAGNAYLNLQIAHAQRGNENENIFISASDDCGATFSLIRVLNGVFINSVPASSNQFVPNDTSEWGFHSVNISNYAGQDNIQFKIVFNARNGNNLWLDDIHISDSDQPTTISSIKKDVFSDFNLYPNPSEGIFTMEYYSATDERIKLELIDMVGKATEIDISDKLSSGWNSLTIDTKENNLKPGMYLLKMNTGDQIYSRRLIIK